MKKIVALILTLIMLGMLVGCDRSDYMKAVALYESGDYMEALEIFAELGDYEDSADMAVKCNYQIAKQHFEKKAYTEAIAEFEALAGYEDSADLLMQCRYEYAKALFDDFKYADAREQFLKAEETEEVRQYLRLSAWNLLQSYVEESGPILGETESYDAVENKKTITTFSVSNNHGVLTIQVKTAVNSEKLSGPYYVRTGKNLDSEIAFITENGSVSIDSEFAQKISTNLQNPFASDRHNVGTAIWNINDFYADGDIFSLVELIEGELNYDFLHEQLINVVEFLQVQLPKTDLGITIRDLGFASY